MTVTLRLVDVRCDERTQMRAATRQVIVDEYAGYYRAGAILPPVEVVFDGEVHWLWDGFHRVFARARAGFEDVEANERNGTLDDARWLAIGANTKHGLRRSNADKRKAGTEALLARPSSSNSELARHVGASQPFIARLRSELEHAGRIPTIDVTVGVDGRKHFRGVDTRDPEQAAALKRRNILGAPERFDDVEPEGKPDERVIPLIGGSESLRPEARTLREAWEAIQTRAGRVHARLQIDALERLARQPTKNATVALDRRDATVMIGLLLLLEREGPKS